MACADNRRFVEAVLYRYRTSILWRDLPVRFGHWKNVHQRFSRWAKPQSLNAMWWQQPAYVAAHWPM
jgi:transposase